MKKQIKTLFSPKKIILWISILLLIFTIPEMNKPAMSKTEAIVTMMSIDSVDDQIKMAVTVITPTQDKQTNFQVYSSEGETLSVAVENMSLEIGKEMGFAQCEIVAMGETLSEKGVMKTLDYMTRTKRVGTNSVLITFSGDVVEFTQAVSDMSQEKSLNLGQIINFDRRFILSNQSNIENFYKDYYSDTSIGIMPKIQFKNKEQENSIEVASSSNGSQQSQQNSTSSEQKKYIVNDGSMVVYKKGKKYLDVSAEEMKKINIFANKNQEGTIIVENVDDEVYNNTNVSVRILDKKLKVKTKFEKDIPIFRVDIELKIFVEEVLDSEPTNNMLRRNREFLTPTLLKKLKEKTTEDMEEIVSFCVENKVDMLGVYKTFNAKNYKSFKNYIDKIGVENFLSNIKFDINVKINSEI